MNIFYDAIFFVDLCEAPCDSNCDHMILDGYTCFFFLNLLNFSFCWYFIHVVQVKGLYSRCSRRVILRSYVVKGLYSEVTQQKGYTQKLCSRRVILRSYVAEGLYSEVM